MKTRFKLKELVASRGKHHMDDLRHFGIGQAVKSNVLDLLNLALEEGILPENKEGDLIYSAEISGEHGSFFMFMIITQDLQQGTKLYSINASKKEATLQRLQGGEKLLVLPPSL